LTVVKLDGAGVKAWLEKSAGYFNRISPSQLQPQTLLNPKFVAYNFDVLQGWPQDHFSYSIDVSKPAGERVQAFFHDHPLDPKQQFLIVTNNYRANGGGHFPGLDGSKTVWAAPDTNRDAVIEFVRARKSLHRSDFDLHPWRFAPDSPKVSPLFPCAAGKLDIAHAADINNVVQQNSAADDLSACLIDLSRH